MIQLRARYFINNLPPNVIFNHFQISLFLSYSTFPLPLFLYSIHIKKILQTFSNIYCATGGLWIDNGAMFGLIWQNKIVKPLKCLKNKALTALLSLGQLIKMRMLYWKFAIKEIFFMFLFLACTGVFLLPVCQDFAGENHVFLIRRKIRYWCHSNLSKETKMNR